MLSLLALFLAGLGLFFHGLSGLRHSLQGLASRRVRGWLARWSDSPFLAGLWGTVMGGLTQSVTAVAFLVASLVGGRLLTVRRALPIVAGANFGTAALVLVASFDIHIAVLLVLGLMGIAVAFDLGGHWRVAFAALFYAGLLFFGLRLMREAFGPLPAMPWFGGAAAIAQSSLLTTFVLGAVLRLFIQSSPAIAVIAITFSRGGLLSPEQAIAMMLGTGTGVAGAVFLLGSNLRGVPRQIALYQAILCLSASLLVGGVLALEQLTGWPLLMHGLAQVPGNESLKMAYGFVALQLTAITLALIGSRWAASLLERWSPPTLEQDLSRPEFIHDRALEDPESALVLAEKEQLRLLARLPRIVDSVRPEAAGTAVPVNILHGATDAVAHELQGFLAAIGGRGIDATTSARWLDLQRRQGLIGALNDTTRDFAAACGRLGGEAELAPLVNSLVEGLHALMGTVVEGLAVPATADRDLLLSMTADRGELVERLRKRVLAASPQLVAEGRLQLVYATSLFERQVWLLRQLAQTLPARGTPDPKANPMGAVAGER